MQDVKYICKKCGFAEKPSKFESLKLFIVLFFMAFGLVAFFTTIGVIVFAKQMIFTQLAYPHNEINPTMSLIYTSAVDIQDTMFLRSYAVNITNSCLNETLDCYSKAIYDEISNYEYALTGEHIYYPEDTIQLKSIDCKNGAITYCALMNNIGGHCKVVCSTTHCWSEVDIENNRTILADLTFNQYKVIT